MKNILLCLLLLGATAGLRAQCLYVNPCNNNAQVCDYSYNDADLWNSPLWWDNNNQTHNLSEGNCNLSSVATDTCLGATSSVNYLFFLDLDGNDTLETVIKSWDPPTPGTVNFNNIDNPNYDGGEPLTFDARAVSADQKFQFALETLVAGNTLTAILRWNTQANPGIFTIPQLPHGAHKIQWTFSDDQSNVAVCEQNFVVKDCANPIAVCLNGLSVNIMPTQQVSLWATDFLQYYEDNTTPTNLLEYGIRKAGTGSGFPEDGNGDPIIAVNFNCPELNTQSVEVWARDAAGNTDYCSTSVLVQDNAGFCSETQPIHQKICIRRPCDGAVVSNVFTIVNGVVNSAPPFTTFIGNLGFGLDGCYHLDSILYPAPVQVDVVITPTKDDDYLNGVSALDLVKISKHILGLEPLSAYGMIAADANKSNSITSFDIIELRKLIQGVYQELPSNYSWCFVDAAFVFPNPLNPFQTAFPEIKSISDLGVDSVYVTEFYALKIGDLDCDATPGAAAPPDERQVKFLTMQDLSLRLGETIDVPVAFQESGDWEALQLGLSFDPDLLEIAAIMPGALPDIAEGSFAMPVPGAMNMVWFTSQSSLVEAGERIFSLQVKAKQACQLSQALQLTHATKENPHALRATGYDAQETAFRFELLFRDNTNAATSTQNTVFQAQPNPSAGAVTIPVQLMQNETLGIEVWDVSGKLVWKQAMALLSGLHLLEIPSEAIGKAGVYSWRIQAGATSAHGKIIKI